MREVNRSRSGKFVWLAGAAILLSSSCANEDSQSDANSIGEVEPAGAEEAAIEQAETRVLAEVITDDGVKYTFLEIDAEDVGVFVVAPDSAASSLKAPRPDLSMVELYESVSGEPAPEALVLAEERARELGLSSHEQADEEDRAPLSSNGDALEARSDDDLSEDMAAQSLPISADAFEDRYCSYAHDFLYCWPSTGGNPYVQRRCRYLYGAICATNCTTRYRYRYKRLGNWKTFVDGYADPGECYFAWTSNWFKRVRRWEVLDNAGCGVRYAAYGDD